MSDTFVEHILFLIIGSYTFTFFVLLFAVRLAVKQSQYHAMIDQVLEAVKEHEDKEEKTFERIDRSINESFRAARELFLEMNREVVQLLKERTKQ